MKKGFFVLIICASLVNLSFAQEYYSHQITSAPKTARYEIVQSEYGARYTAKIDKYTGDIFLLVKAEEELTWELMLIEEHYLDMTIPNQVNYQIFMSGLGARFIFLLNVNSGTTWQLVEDKISHNLFWATLE